MVRQRAYLLVALFALLLVLFPFLFWYTTWFGRKLTGPEISAYLADHAKPRHAQHALVQIGERLARHDPAAAQWYPQVVELSASPLIELRETSAWIMGQDHTYAPFHEALLKMLADPQPLVRRNAAPLPITVPAKPIPFPFTTATSAPSICARSKRTPKISA
jgi:hypothetical protein